MSGFSPILTIRCNLHPSISLICKFLQIFCYFSKVCKGSSPLFYFFPPYKYISGIAANNILYIPAPKWPILHLCWPSIFLSFTYFNYILLAYLDLAKFTPRFTWPCPLVYIAIVFSIQYISLSLPVLPVTQYELVPSNTYTTSVVAAVHVLNIHKCVANLCLLI